MVLTTEGVKNLMLTSAISVIITGTGFWFLVGGRLATQTELNTANIAELKEITRQTLQVINQTTVEQARLVERLDNYLTSVGAEAMIRNNYILKSTSDGQWMIVLVAGNGEMLVWSESYTRREDAVRAYNTIRWAAFKAFFSGLIEKL